MAKCACGHHHNRNTGNCDICGCEEMTISARPRKDPIFDISEQFDEISLDELQEEEGDEEEDDLPEEGSLFDPVRDEYDDEEDDIQEEDEDDTEDEDGDDEFDS